METTRRGFLGALLGAAAAVSIPFKWGYSKARGLLWGDDTVHLYVNSMCGDDANDGLSPQTAVRSLDAVRPKMPTKHNRRVTHLRGEFRAPSDLQAPTTLYLEENSTLYIDEKK